MCGRTSGKTAHRLTVDGGRVRTDGPLEVLENSSDPTSIAHEVTIDVVCDRFGGALDDVTRLASETLGVALPDPAGGGPGSLTVNGADYELSTTSCNSSGDVTELNAESPDGAVTLYVSVTPLSDIVFVGIDGQRWIRDRDLEVVVKGDEMRSPGPIELVDQYTRASVGTITFRGDLSLRLCKHRCGTVGQGQGLCHLPRLVSDVRGR